MHESWFNAWIQVFWKCGSAIDRRNVIVHCSLFVVEHDERNDPGPNCGLLRIHFTTTHGKVKTGIIGESIRF